MTPERWQQVKEIFDRAVECGPASRMAYIRDRCGDDEELRREVESLLASDTQTGSLLDDPLMETHTGVSAPYNPDAASPLQNDSFGPYVPVRVLGEGGMGTVYLAQQQQPISRVVALKVVKLGMDSRQVLERFEIERQALALMDYPNVARVLDAGTSERGRPYFVMEYVDGVPITQYCDRKALSTRERLQLFIPVCNALQHAHKKGIIHRDVKPSNVLVTEVDGRPVPKVIDFGVARATEQRSAECDAFTLSGQLIGTPEYMSPEQASLNSRDIDTGTDVYSLGVVLYELLVGMLPLDIKSLRKMALGELLRAIRETPIPKPTARITQMGVAAEGLALQRNTNPGQLKRELAGDLDSIVMKAIDKDRHCRYASASEFAADIGRYLRDEPVLASPPGMAYRTRKFVRRHRAWLATAILVFLTLVGGIIASTWQAHIASRQRERAERRFNDVRKLANSILFELHDAILPLPGSTVARELLLRRAQEYLDSLAVEGRGDAALQRERALAYQRIGDVQGTNWQANFGKTSLAIENQKKSLDIFKGLAAADPTNLELQRDLGTSYRRVCTLEQTNGKFKDALEACGKDVELREAIAKARPGNQTAQYELGFSYQALASPLFLLGDFKGSEQYRAKALAIYTELHQAHPDDRNIHFELAVAMLRMASMQEQLKEYPAALESARKAVALYEDLSARHPDDVRLKLNTTFALQRVGSVLISLNDLPGALEVFQKSLPLREKLSALDPADVRTKMNLCHSHESIGWVLVRLGRVREADEHFRKQLDLAQQLVGTDKVRIEYQRALAGAYENLGSVFERDRKCREARAYYDKALKVFEALSARSALSAEYAEAPGRLKKLIANCRTKY